MARKNKKSKRTRVTTKDRQDYRTGGRVGYQPGGRVPGEPGAPLPRAVRPSERGRETPSAPTPAPVVTTQAPMDADVDLVDLKDDATPTPTTPTTPDTTSTTTPTVEEERQKAREAAQATIEGSKELPKPKDIEVATADESIKGEVVEMAAAPQITAEQATMEGIAPERVTEVTDVAQVEAPTPITAAEVEPVTVAAAPEIEAARGAVSEESLAQAAGVERIDPIEAATVEIVPGALTERVVGVLSPEAKAQAAEVAGTDLGRVTRAKKQLRNAGISETVITELGNDPEALEDALMDLTEEERGVIEGLPEEALVSNQMDTLLSGIEQGEIPAWARPAVASVEAMLANRGMSASTVGRDALFNAIIQSAIPIAQSNASAIQSAIQQERNIEAQVAIKEAEFQQQTALSNAQRVFQFDLAQFNADQQTALSNSKFLQTVALTEAGFDQQATVQNAVLMSQANLAEADLNQRAQIQNAQSFLQMDMANLNNEQQAIVLQAQQDQQRILSNQSAQNAAQQFNATSENQVNQFMASLNAEISRYNATQMNAANQFNAAAKNAAEARRVQNEVELEKINTQLAQEANELNTQLEFQRNQFNAANAQAVAQADAAWRRQINLAETTAQNAINQQNVQNQFALSKDAQAFLWQDLRDQADFAFRAAQNKEDREAQIISTAIGADPKKYANGQQELRALLSELV